MLKRCNDGIVRSVTSGHKSGSAKLGAGGVGVSRAAMLRKALGGLQTQALALA